MSDSFCGMEHGCPELVKWHSMIQETSIVKAQVSDTRPSSLAHELSLPPQMQVIRQHRESVKLTRKLATPHMPSLPTQSLCQLIHLCRLATSVQSLKDDESSTCRHVGR